MALGQQNRVIVRAVHTNFMVRSIYQEIMGINGQFIFTKGLESA